MVQTRAPLTQDQIRPCDLPLNQQIKVQASELCNFGEEGVEMYFIFEPKTPCLRDILESDIFVLTNLVKGHQVKAAY